jgi:hypothetical protein
VIAGTSRASVFEAGQCPRAGERERAQVAIGVVKAVHRILVQVLGVRNGSRASSGAGAVVLTYLGVGEERKAVISRSECGGR